MDTTIISIENKSQDLFEVIILSLLDFGKVFTITPSRYSIRVYATVQEVNAFLKTVPVNHDFIKVR